MKMFYVVLAVLGSLSYASAGEVWVKSHLLIDQVWKISYSRGFLLITHSQSGDQMIVDRNGEVGSTVPSQNRIFDFPMTLAFTSHKATLYAQAVVDSNPQGVDVNFRKALSVGNGGWSIQSPGQKLLITEGVLRIAHENFEYRVVSSLDESTTYIFGESGADSGEILDQVELTLAWPPAKLKSIKRTRNRKWALERIPAERAQGVRVEAGVIPDETEFKAEVEAELAHSVRQLTDLMIRVQTRVDAEKKATTQEN